MKGKFRRCKESEGRPLFYTKEQVGLMHSIDYIYERELVATKELASSLPEWEVDAEHKQINARPT